MLTSALLKTGDFQDCVVQLSDVKKNIEYSLQTGCFSGGAITARCADRTGSLEGDMRSRLRTAGSASQARTAELTMSGCTTLAKSAVFKL